MDIKCYIFYSIALSKIHFTSRKYISTQYKTEGENTVTILTGLHVFRLHVHEIIKPLMKCNDNTDCLYICAFSMQRCDFF